MRFGAWTKRWAVPVHVLPTVPAQVAPVLAYRYRTVLCTRTAVGSPVIFRFRAELAFFARSESNPEHELSNFCKDTEFAVIVKIGLWPRR